MLFRSFIFCACAAALQLSAVAGTVYAPELPVRSGLIAARIESDKPVYQLGEPIRLRLTLVNKTAHEIYYVAAAPFEISNLQIFKDGRQLSPSSGPAISSSDGRTYTIPLAPGKPVVVEYNDRLANGALREWADIRQWGYHLSAAGNYSISASAAINAIGDSGPEFHSPSVGKSNVVHIRVLN